MEIFYHMLLSGYWFNDVIVSEQDSFTDELTPYYQRCLQGTHLNLQFV